jgi:hypothetical protein
VIPELVTVRIVFEGPVPLTLMDELRKEWLDNSHHITTLDLSLDAGNGYKWRGQLGCVSVELAE